ncbi:HVO_0758 family zinc finger protein [Halobacteriaceae archaeon GCM10025711]
MESVRKGLRAGKIQKDTYDRLSCASCGSQLKTQDDPGEVWTLRVCPECGRQWRQLG